MKTERIFFKKIDVEDYSKEALHYCHRLAIRPEDIPDGYPTFPIPNPNPNEASMSWAYIENPDEIFYACPLEDLEDEA